jgi:hypothetical protein
MVGGRSRRPTATCMCRVASDPCRPAACRFPTSRVLESGKQQPRLSRCFPSRGRGRRGGDGASYLAVESPELVSNGYAVHAPVA